MIDGDLGVITDKIISGKDLGYDVKALARIKSLKDGVIEFEEE